MSILQALLLGLSQGLTEFFPVSSSGHLILGQYLFGLSHLNQYLFFDLICHVGTLCALFIVFFSKIKELLFLDRSRLLQVIIGTLPLFPLVLIMKPIKVVFNSPEYLGYCFFVTAFLLYLSASFQIRERTPKKWMDPFIIGLFQAFAILPGISRSGATISAGNFLGWGKQEAITFSFLLAIPAILGGLLLESFQILKNVDNTASIGLSQYMVGFFSSFITGYFALNWLIKLVFAEKMHYFVLYCIFIGICSIVIFG